MTEVKKTTPGVVGYGSVGEPRTATSGKTKFQEANESAKSAKIAVGVGAGVIVGLGIALRNGLTESFHTIASVSRKICGLVAIPVAVFYPLVLLMNEFNFLKGKNKSNDENKLAKFINPAVSISFATETFCDPLEKATQSPLHMATSLINLPHLVFVLLSYTGGRFMTLLKTVQLVFNPPKEKKLRLEQDADAFHLIGNMGSEHAGIAPLPHLFSTGCQNIASIFTGDFSTLFEKFTKNPISTILTFPSIISFIPDFIGKALDTSIRTAEASEQIQNAFGDEKNSKIIRELKRFKNFWHSNCTKDTFLGKFLKYGREIAKIDKLVLAPSSMIAVVCPMLDKVFRLEIFNKEAQEKGGIAKLADTILSPISFFGHLYFTTLYGLTVRAPQIMVSSIFYGTNLVNYLRGAKLGSANYLEADNVRNKIFNRGIFKWISDKASNGLDSIESQLHPDDPKLIKDRTFTRIKVEDGKQCIDSATGKPIEETITVQGKGRSRFIQSYAEIMAEQEAYIPAREEFYKEEKVKHMKETGKSLTDKQWGDKLEEKKNHIIELAKEKFILYLKVSEQFTDENLNEFFVKHKKYEEINQEVTKLLEKEIAESRASSSAIASRKFQIKADSLWQMLLHPVKYFEDIKNVFCLRTFMAKFVIFPLNVLGFVNGAEYGKEGESYKLRKHQAEEQIIRVHNNKIAVESEIAPVLAQSYRNAAEAIQNIAA